MSILVPGLFRAEDVIDVENVVAVLVVIAIVLDPLARLGQHTAGIARRLVLESGIADAVSGGEVHGEGLERLSSQSKVSIGGDERDDPGSCSLLTLMKPPSGLARRKGGWALTLGLRSVGARILLNSGTGPLSSMGWARLGDLGSA